MPRLKTSGTRFESNSFESNVLVAVLLSMPQSYSDEDRMCLQRWR